MQGWNAGRDELGDPPLMGSVRDSYNTYISYDYIYIKAEDLSVGATRGSEEKDEPFDSRDRGRYRPSDSRNSSRRALRSYNADRDIYSRRNGPQEVDALAKARYGTLEITTHQLFLLYPQAPAFALSTKQWSKFYEC